MGVGNLVELSVFKQSTIYKVLRTAVLVSCIAGANNIYASIAAGDVHLGIYQTVILAAIGVILEILNGLKTPSTQN